MHIVSHSFADVGKFSVSGLASCLQVPWNHISSWESDVCHSLEELVKPPNSHNTRHHQYKGNVVVQLRGIGATDSFKLHHKWDATRAGVVSWHGLEELVNSINFLPQHMDVFTPPPPPPPHFYRNTAPPSPFWQVKYPLRCARPHNLSSMTSFLFFVYLYMPTMGACGWA